MASWDRLGESNYVGVMTRHEIEVLNSYVSGVLGLLSHRAEFYLPIDGTQAQMPVDCADDCRINAILAVELGEGEPDWILALNEERVLREVAEAVRLMGSTLPASGGVVMLRAGEELASWLRCIRHVLAVIAVVADYNGNVKDQASEPTVIWLNKLADGLIAAAAQISPDFQDHA